MPPWLLSGVASLAGSLLTRRDARKEAARVDAANKAEAARIQQANQILADKVTAENTEKRKNYYSNLVSDSQSAGINPLTALRTGGGMGYATAVGATMSNAVMLEGVYRTPTLSRNPLAASIDSGMSTYMGSMRMRQSQAHDVRMNELNSKLSRANSLALQKAERYFTHSPDGKLPPRDQWYKYLRNEDMSLALDDDGYAQIREGRKSIPLTSYYRIPRAGGSSSFLSLNMESFESGTGEVLASSIVHAGAAGSGQMKRFIDQYVHGIDPNAITKKELDPHQDDPFFGAISRYLSGKTFRILP